MIQCQLKLRLNTKQEQTCGQWLYHLTPIWNWGVRKVELNAKDKIYFSKHEFQNLLANHGEKLGIPSHTIQGVLVTVHQSWSRCFKGLAKKPRLKGMRRPLNSIPFPDPITEPEGNKIRLPGIGKVRFHGMDIPEGKIKCGRLVKRASGWYLCLFIDAEPKTITRTAESVIGIDPGFKDLLTFSDGEIIEHPRELRIAAKRLAQAQRGHRKQLTARIHERVSNKRKDRNHKLSRTLVAENKIICFLKDNHRAIAKRFGKSVCDSAHGGLRRNLSYKSLIGGTELVFPENKNSTRTCSTCGALSGPTGLAGLKVRQWVCGACGAHHERDVNSARNALIVGAGLAHEVSYAHA